MNIDEDDIIMCKRTGQYYTVMGANDIDGLYYNVHHERGAEGIPVLEWETEWVNITKNDIWDTEWKYNLELAPYDTDILLDNGSYVIVGKKKVCYDYPERDIFVHGFSTEIPLSWCLVPPRSNDALRQNSTKIIDIDDIKDKL